MKRFVLGDLHGGYLPLMQVLDRANFNMQDDLLITLGDIVDGWPDTKKCVEFLINCHNHVGVRGNHDEWFLSYLQERRPRMGTPWPLIWLDQGGEHTLNSYDTSIRDPEMVPAAHRKFFEDQKQFYVLDNMLFVHGGVSHIHQTKGLQPEKDEPDDSYWNRTLWRTAIEHDLAKSPIIWPPYDKVFIGHTPIDDYCDGPLTTGNLVMMDTGGGRSGTLSLMNIDTGEFWQSDLVKDLYPGHRPRG